MSASEQNDSMLFRRWMPQTESEYQHHQPLPCHLKRCSLWLSLISTYLSELSPRAYSSQRPVSVACLVATWAGVEQVVQMGVESSSQSHRLIMNCQSFRTICSGLKKRGNKECLELIGIVYPISEMKYIASYKLQTCLVASVH